MFSKCGAEVDSWEFLGQQQDQTSQSSRKSTLVIQWKDWQWSEAPILWPPDAKSQHWCWERLRARRKGGNRGWDSWKASVTQWTLVWANSGKEWRTGKPGMSQSMGVTKSVIQLSD